MSEYAELEDAAWNIAESLERIRDLLEAFATIDPAVQGALRMAEDQKKMKRDAERSLVEEQREAFGDILAQAEFLASGGRAEPLS